eukprot:scaffold1397_cov254-Pinguiococcus_pyrenoidosus.AAC.17
MALLTRHLSLSRHSPLERDLARDRVLGRVKKKAVADDADDAEEAFLSAADSRRVLEEAKRQREEIELEERGGQAGNRAEAGGFFMGGEEDDDDESIGMEINEEDEDLIQVEDGEWVQAGGVLSEAEERLIARFMQEDEGASQAAAPRLLSDIILEKIQMQEFASARAAQDGERPEIPEKVVQVYTEIGKILQHWGRVRVPKAFKVIPHLTNWEDILYLTRPDEWSPHSWYDATCVSSSG